MTETWYVGRIGDAMALAFDSEREALAAIEGISLIDPKGIKKGMYYIDPPGHEMDGPGEGAIYSSEIGRSYGCRRQGSIT